MHQISIWAFFGYKLANNSMTTVLEKNVEIKCTWRNLHRWQKFYTAAGSDGRDKSHLCRTGLRDQHWPACKGDLITWPPDQPRTLLAEHLGHLLLKREGFWGKPVGFYLIHRKRQVGSERSPTFRTLRLETWDLNNFLSKSLLGNVLK